MFLRAHGVVEYRSHEYTLSLGPLPEGTSALREPTQAEMERINSFLSPDLTPPADLHDHPDLFPGGRPTFSKPVLPADE